MDNPKYNIIMPETDDRAICMMVDKPISIEGYSKNFLPRIKAMVEKHGEIRALVYYKEYKGWEEQAALLDIATIADYGDKVLKIAMVNPPEKRILQFKIKQSMFTGTIKLFDENELQKAIEWVKS